MNRYIITGNKEHTFDYQKFTTDTEEWQDWDPDEIESGDASVQLDFIQSNLTFDLRKLNVKRLTIYHSIIDLCNPFIPRDIETVNIQNSILTGNFNSYMNVKYLSTSSIKYITNIPNYKRFFKNVSVFGSLDSSIWQLPMTVPLSASVIRLSHASFKLKQANEFLLKHPNCRALPLRIDSVTEAIEFISKHKLQLILHWQMKDAMLDCSYPTQIALRSTILSDNFLLDDLRNAKWIGNNRRDRLLTEDEMKESKKTKEKYGFDKQEGVDTFITNRIAAYLTPRKPTMPFPEIPPAPV